MKLHGKILILGLMCVSAFLAVNIWEVQGVIREYERALVRTWKIQGQAVERNLTAIVDEMEIAAGALSRSGETVKAVETADNEILFECGAGFLHNIDTVFFTDKQGLVLARSPDEFRFGDSLAGQDYFRAAMENGGFSGIRFVDGEHCLLRIKPVNKYDDLPVGVVGIIVHITPEFLHALSPSENVTVVFGTNERDASGTIGDNQFVRREEISFHIPDAGNAGPKFTALFAEDSNYRQLVHLKTSIYINTIGATVVITSIFLFFLYSRLRPYSIVAGLILAYAREEKDHEELRQELMDFQSDSRSDVKKITGALISMLELIRTHFRSLESYNAELSRTVEQLEQALNEVKLLGGLLPICANCKKIRDDSGYWSQVEEYISKHSDATFSHSICPECMEKLYPDIAAEILKKTKTKK